MPLNEDVIVVAEANGYGTYGVDIFKSAKSVIPAGDGPFTTIVETGGSGPEFIHSHNGAAFRHPSTQVMVRAKTYDVAMSKARELYDLVVGHNLTIASGFYRSIKPLQEPYEFPVDDLRRPRVVFNLIGDRRPV